MSLHHHDVALIFEEQLHVDLNMMHDDHYFFLSYIREEWRSAHQCIFSAVQKKTPAN